jgi:hypothetical protein
LLVSCMLVFLVSCVTKQEITELRHDEYRYGYVTSITGFINAVDEFYQSTGDKAGFTISVNGINKSFTTGSDGKYVIENVKVDEYIFSISRPGYITNTFTYRVNTAEGNAPIYFSPGIYKASTTTLTGLKQGLYSDTTSDPISQLFTEDVLEVIGQVQSDTSSGRRRGIMVFLDTLPTVSKDSYLATFNSMNSNNGLYPIYTNSYYNYGNFGPLLRNYIYQNYSNNSAYCIVPMSSLKGNYGLNSGTNVYIRVYGISSNSRYYYYNQSGTLVNDFTGETRYDYVNPLPFPVSSFRIP